MADIQKFIHDSYYKLNKSHIHKIVTGIFEIGMHLKRRHII